MLSTKPIKKIISATLLGSAFFSCAYFNTYYNTKKYFNEALEENKNRTTDRPTASERQKFDKTISQASKVLQLYPDSKYVDDALLILGKSFYYIEDYRKAERKFQELIEFFPNSEKVEAAQLWLAKTQLSLLRYDLAFTDLQKLVQSAKEKKIRHEAQYWLGESYFQQELYAEASQTFNAVLEKIDDEELLAHTYKRLGECYLQQQSYFQAAQSFQQAAKRSRNLEKQFDLNLQYAKALNAAGTHDEAIENLEGLIAQNEQHKMVGLAKLELANSYLAKNADEKAIEIYNDIIEIHPQTTAAAGAYLALAQYDEKVLTNYEAAEENYRQAALQDNRSEYAKVANKQAVFINNLRKLQSSISALKQQLDSRDESGEQNSATAVRQIDDTIASRDSGTTAEARKLPAAEERLANSTKTNARKMLNDELETLARESRQERTDVAEEPQSRKQPNGQSQPEPQKSPPQPLTQTQIDSINLLITDKKIELAESFYFNFGQVDSALFYYFDAISGSNSNEHRALAFYSIAEIYGSLPDRSVVRDSVLTILANNYGETPQGAAARELLGIEHQSETGNPLAAAYEEAQNLYLKQDNPQAAIRTLQKILSGTPAPNDDLHKKAIFLTGWLHENKLNNNEQALAFYRQLVEEYPNSEQAKRVKKKVQAVEQEQQKAENPEPTAPEQPQAGTTVADSSAASSQPPRPPSPTKTDSLKASAKDTLRKAADKQRF